MTISALREMPLQQASARHPDNLLNRSYFKLTITLLLPLAYLDHFEMIETLYLPLKQTVQAFCLWLINRQRDRCIGETRCP